MRALAVTRSNAAPLENLPHLTMPDLPPALRSFAARLDLAARLVPFAAHRWDHPRDRPTVHLDDVSGIPFLVDVSGVEEYQHRARLRCGDGDLFVTVTGPTLGYERYCRQRLGLGAPTHLHTTPAANPLAVAAGSRHPDVQTRLVDTARGAGGLEIHPYMGIEDVWDLAAAIAAASGEPVTVLAPPPPVTWIANDKALFAELVELTLGPGWMPEAVTCRAPDEMARHLQALSRGYSAVGLKRTRCASAMGNKVFRSPLVMAASEDALTAEVVAFLRRTEWRDGEEVLVVAWENAVCSPSTQLWIEPGAPPRVDGIYEQVLEGPEQVFVGSRPSMLPARVNRVLADAAVRVATALQYLGYVGRCSFDHLVLGDPEADFHGAVHRVQWPLGWHKHPHASGGSRRPRSPAPVPGPGHRVSAARRGRVRRPGHRAWRPSLRLPAPGADGICFTMSVPCGGSGSSRSSRWPAVRPRPMRRCCMSCRAVSAPARRPVRY